MAKHLDDAVHYTKTLRVGLNHERTRKIHRAQSGVLP